MRLRALAGILTLSAGLGVAFAAAPAEVIKARQDQMKALGAEFRVINEALKNSAPDAAAIAVAGKKIAEQIKGTAAFYPAGSGPESGVKTRALAEIWAQPDVYRKAADASVAEAGRFEKTAAGGDLAAIRSGFKALTDSCVSCHDKFRGPEEKK